VGNKLFTLINDEGQFRLGVTEGGALRRLTGPGIAGPASQLTEFRGKVFFAEGMVLWRSDGTEAGTRVVKAIGPARIIVPGPASSSPRDFTRSGDFVFFATLRDSSPSC
jgi:ELWxxDGT repeat protein